MEVAWCTCKAKRNEGWTLHQDRWVHPNCLKPTRHSYVVAMRADYHVFLGGELPENEAYSTAMLLNDRDLIREMHDYVCTTEIKYSESNPEVFARVWRKK